MIFDWIYKLLYPKMYIIVLNTCSSYYKEDPIEVIVSFHVFVFLIFRSRLEI